MSTSVAPPPPQGGNGKYILVALLFLLGIGALVWKLRAPGDPQPVPVIPSAPVTLPTNPKIDDVPPPPPEEPDSGPEEVKKPTTADNGCRGITRCSGSATPDLETALAFRAKQAHRCYDQALAQDSTLQGKVQISVRVASNGNVCSAGVASNDMGNPSVAQCVARTFASAGHFPAPKGGCIDANVPISFVPGGH